MPQNIIGFGIGGLFFSAGGFLLYAQGSVAKCKVQSSTTTHDVLVRTAPSQCHCMQLTASKACSARQCICCSPWCMCRA